MPEAWSGERLPPSAEESARATPMRGHRRPWHEFERPPPPFCLIPRVCGRGLYSVIAGALRASGQMRPRKFIAVSVHERADIAPQTPLLQPKTFCPSRGPSGMRLKEASQRFMDRPSRAT
jgi:hypothetical protein